MHPRKFLHGAILAGLLVAAQSSDAGDWPRWRGPELNGTSSETGWFKPWPAEGPKQLWKANVQDGFSTVSILDGRLFTTGSKEGQETIFCLDVSSGKEVWRFTYATTFKPQFYEGGSSGTPTADGDRVYHLGQMGEVFCLEAATGRIVWSNQVVKAFGVTTPTWGLTGAPLVLGNQLILNTGAAGAALDKRTGAKLWSSAGEGGYATPLPLKEKEVLIYGTKGLHNIRPESGEVIWFYPYKTRYDVNAADPLLVSGNRIFISAGYDHGSALLELKEGKPTLLWESKTMRNQFNASVLLGEYLYGIDGDAGRRGSGLKCVALKDGAVKWSEVAIGSGALTAADGKLIVLSEKGELIIAEATPEAFKPISRAQVLGGKCWTVPVLSNGKIYCRNSRGDLVCVDPGKP